MSPRVKKQAAKQTAAEPVSPGWADMMPAEHWAVYRPVLERLLAPGWPFALGGGLAYSTYAHRWRNTKDIDLFILPRHREAMIQEVLAAGFVDYFEQVPYDRGWIFRAYRDGVIVDLIWEMANHHAEVDLRWIERGPEIRLRGLSMRVLALEEFLWSKLYVFQRDRCDWPDLLSIVYAHGQRVDWHYLIERVGEDIDLISALMTIYSWLCPRQATELPDWLWPRLRLPPPRPGPSCDQDRSRIARLDTREWFFPESPR